jgi:phosphoribosylglycinamide formyltransferase-1
MESIIQATQTGILKGVGESVLVFSNHPDAKGLEIAQKMGVKTYTIPSKGRKRIEYDREIREFLEDYEFDYIILAGYMRMLSTDFVLNFPHKIINIHPADTTQHQGLHGYEWAFENHLEETKITIHFVDVGLDTGKIISQKTVDLKGAKTLEEVELRGLAVEHQFYPETLYRLFRGFEF